MAQKDKNIDVGRLSDEEKQSTAIYSKDEQNSKIVGFAGGDMVVPSPTFLQTGNEHIFPKSNTINAQIVIARDRPNSIFSGYGGKGHQKCSTIDISEKTDIDENFNLTDTNRFVHKSEGRSAIGIKADAVRIIGNEGVKIVTGVYADNSRGGDATPAGIVLVAMNDNEDASVLEVEPFAKGKKLEACLYSLEDQVYKLNSLHYF